MPAEGVDRALGASYQLVERIGRGAAGEVWRGTDRRTGEQIAAKLLRSEYVEDHELVGRFIRERSILVGLRHPNIVAVRDLVAEGDRLAFVMEYVDGGSLRTVLADGPLPAGLALHASVGVLDGLTLAHERRVLHRDVKPDNVLVASRWRETAPLGVKLSDFGVSSLLGDRGGTSTGLVGTPEYMAPEQLLTGSADVEVDVYAAGVLLYELLAGRTPFAGPGTGYVIAHRHVTSLPPRLPVPAPLWEALEQLLDKSPAGRPTAREASALLRALPEEVFELPALETQLAPASFPPAGGPATELRGIERPRSSTSATDSTATATPSDPTAAGSGAGTGRSSAPPLPDLGAPSGETILRPMVVAATTRPTEPAEELPRRRVVDRLRSVRWRSPQAVASLVAIALVIGLGVFWIAERRGSPSTGPSAEPTAVPVQQQSQPTVTGLGIARSATWDAATRSARLTISYSAQRAPLLGPFLEVLPATTAQGRCPSVVWENVTVRRNLSAVTGIDAPCGWSVEPAQVPARGTTQVSATVALGALDGDPTAALQQWLQSAAEATETATGDSDTASTAYPAQRMTDIQVVAPSRTVSGRTLRISLLPVWPNGVDQLNPLFVSPPSGRPSTTLIAVAGGTSGVRFSDGCSGALSISPDGLVVSAASVSDSCQVDATVGNFTDLSSNSFAITTRGS
ncbi:serine/threonine-protein kinase [Microlunatus ginsengisoli]|uniref:non-specific serine/threonine protein kinase n=1 Tax=Microlunatus ginsengisoli TaxID=363863 RepID=A0ABP7A939_9ACTN